MKTVTKILSIIFLFSISTNALYATSYVSAGAGPSDWNNSATWSPVGTPTTADDVTISAGHTVNISTNGNVCKNLTIDGTLAWTTNVSLSCYGNYTVSATGAESAPVLGKITFFSPGTTLDVTGTSHSKLYYNFASNRTILAGSVINKTSAYTTIGASKTVTNLGNYTMGNVSPGASSTWINGANSTLSLRLTGFMAGKTFTASAAGNTVIIRYATGALPTVTANTFCNLSLMATTAGSKTLTVNTILSGNLTINSNNTLNSNNFDLSVGGNWTSAGTFTASTGKTVTFNGTAASQSISNTTGTTTFKRIAISNTNGVNLTTGTYILDEVLTVTDGTFNTGGRPFTMTSDAGKTARIAPITGTGAIAGNFTIQRFITARDTTFADLASPVQNSTFADWETELQYMNYTSNPPSSQASAASYDEAADDYVPVTSSGTAIDPGKGYEVFLTGGFAYTNFPATTLTTIGVPNQGDFDLSSTVSNTVQGWNLVGNPFASSISWSSVYTASGGAGSGMYDYIEMYDYTIADWNGYTSADAIEIGATQGFWVYGLAGPMTLLIPESSKTTTSNSSIKMASMKQPYFTLKLGSTTSNVAHVFKVATSDVASNGLDTKDIPFRASLNKTTPEMYCMVDGKKININNFNSSNDSYSIPLKTKANVSGNYKIEAAGFDFIDYTCVKLQDNLTGKLIDLTEGNGYCFTMNATDNEDRFILHFSKDNNCKTLASTTVSPSVDFDNQVEILPSSQGNVVNFNLSETTNTNISIVNVLGQTIVESISLEANTQSVNIALPEGFTGLYILKVESAKGSITKKFVKK